MIKRVQKTQKLELVLGRNAPANLVFNESLGRADSIYKTKLVEALQNDALVCILKDDKYMLNQLKTAAKKLNLRLTFAIDGDKLYVKPIRLEGERKKLFLYLRERRTMTELQARKYELDLQTTLAQETARGLVKQVGNGYELTESGHEALEG